jgi:lysophospholipase L1-like esterase
MRRVKWTAVLFTTMALLVVGMAAPASARPMRVLPHPVYLALGDSWAYGEGATEPAVDGYVPQLDEVLEQELNCFFARGFHRGWTGCKHLQLVNLARPATETLPGVTAPQVASEQLPVAIPMLMARNGDHNPRNDVEVITLHVGGNDVSGPIQQACIGGLTPECLTTFVTEMGTFEADLDNVVSQLRAASGPDTPIVLGTYDNPVPYCNLAAIPGAIELGALVLEGAPDGSLDGVNDVVRRVAANYDAEVAEVYGELGAGDFVGGDDCLHPTDTGYDLVTDSFVATLGL